MAYRQNSIRIAKNDLLMIIMILEPTYFQKNIITFIDILPTKALQILHFLAYKICNETSQNKEPIALRELVLLYKIDPT